MASFLKNLFTRKRKLKQIVEQSDPAEQIDRMLGQLRDRLGKFLITRNVASGVVKKTTGWTVSKTNQGLFRLESDRVSVLISTEPFLIRKDGKIAGLLGMSEVDLCRALATGKSVSEFFKRSYPVRGKSIPLMNAVTGKKDSDSKASIEDLPEWMPFDIHQMIARNRPNIIAHVLIQGSESVVTAIMNSTSIRYKRMLVTELESLLSPGSAPELNPGSKNYGLLSFETAIEEFEDQMNQYIFQQKLKNRTMEKVAV